MGITRTNRIDSGTTQTKNNLYAAVELGKGMFRDSNEAKAFSDWAMSDSTCKKNPYMWNPNLLVQTWRQNGWARNYQEQQAKQNQRSVINGNIRPINPNPVVNSANNIAQQEAQVQNIMRQRYGLY